MLCAAAKQPRMAWHFKRRRLGSGAMMGTCNSQVPIKAYFMPCVTLAVL